MPTDPEIQKRIDALKAEVTKLENELNSPKNPYQCLVWMPHTFPKLYTSLVEIARKTGKSATFKVEQINTSHYFYLKVVYYHSRWAEVYFDKKEHSLNGSSLAWFIDREVRIVDISLA